MIFKIVEEFTYYSYSPNLLNKCVNTCCDHLVVIINGLNELGNYSTESKFYMYIFINLKAGEEPDKINMNLDNVIIFQLVEKALNYFRIFERKTNEIKQIYTWDGNYFWDNANKKHDTLARNFEGEVLRVGSGPMMPWAFIWTLEDGTQIVGSGGYHEYLRVISAHDNLIIKWIDAYHQEGAIWGTLFKNGSSTGLTKLVIIHEIDLAVGMYCGVRLHRNLYCSEVIKYDGYAALLLKPKPLPTWLGIILPFDMYTWFGILATIFSTTLILGVCVKYVLKSEKIDWTLHFLDAFHPMCGRNMTLPGLSAAHLGKE